MLIFNSKKRDFYTNRLTFYQQQISAQQQQKKNPKATYRALGTFLPQLKIWQTCNITLLPQKRNMLSKFFNLSNLYSLRLSLKMDLWFTNIVKWSHFSQEITLTNETEAVKAMCKGFAEKQDQETQQMHNLESVFHSCNSQWLPMLQVREEGTEGVQDKFWI